MRYSLRTILVVVLLAAVLSYIFRPVDWEAQLWGVCEKATSLQVEVVSYGGEEARKHVESIELRDKSKMNELLRAIRVNTKDSTASASAMGHVFLVFREDEDVVCTLMLIPSHIRWVDGCWPGDANLTAESRRLVIEWLKRNAPVARTFTGEL